jgi:hypothetical protein
MDGTIPAMERVYTAPLLDKLGVRPGMRVAIVGDLDADPEAATIREALADRTSDVAEQSVAPQTDLVILVADSIEELGVLDDLRGHIRPAGAIWVVFRKGTVRTLRDVEVIAAAREHGLVDNKVVAFSRERTAFRLVIPIALRPRS